MSTPLFAKSTRYKEARSAGSHISRGIVELDLLALSLLSSLLSRRIFCFPLRATFRCRRRRVKLRGRFRRFLADEAAEIVGAFRSLFDANLLLRGRLAEHRA